MGQQEVHSRFFNLMWLAVHTPRVLTLCLQPSLLNELQYLEKCLEKCEKSINAYLETKCRLFSRFFFISSADLLSILGGPEHSVQHIIPFLNKMFDNVSGLMLNQVRAPENFSFTVCFKNVMEHNHVSNSESDG